MSLSECRFLRACRRLPTDCTPIWLMRQAGRYMPEYRALRQKYSMMQLIETPELAAEVTMQPIEAFEFDAAIIFSDILPPLIGMGLEVEFVAGKGPVIHNPIDSPSSVDRLSVEAAMPAIEPTLQAISLIAPPLADRRVPLIGFAGAPFTLACYAIQGGGSKMYERAKRFMYSCPEAWQSLMTKLTDVVSDYLVAQVTRGASALQVFDSWAGMLAAEDYRRFVAPFNTALFDRLSNTGVPVINFSTGTSGYLDVVANCGGDIVGVDWRLPLRQAWDSVGRPVAIQGNLDPTVLLGPWDEVAHRADGILAAAKDRHGHVFNLGHGILPETPVETVRRLVDHVHQASAGHRDRCQSPMPE